MTPSTGSEPGRSRGSQRLEWRSGDERAVCAINQHHFPEMQAKLPGMLNAALESGGGYSVCWLGTRPVAFYIYRLDRADAVGSVDVYVTLFVSLVRGRPFLTGMQHLCRTALAHGAGKIRFKARQSDGYACALYDRFAVRSCATLNGSNEPSWLYEMSSPFSYFMEVAG